MNEDYPEYDYYEETDMPIELSPERKAREYMKQALAILYTCQSSRENSLAITNLQQAIMWNRAAQESKEGFSVSDQPHQ